MVGFIGEILMNWFKKEPTYSRKEVEEILQKTIESVGFKKLLLDACDEAYRIGFGDGEKKRARLT